jgi:hypothetical protein
MRSTHGGPGRWLEHYGRELLVAEGRLSAILEAVSRLVERRRDRGEQH